MSKFTPFYGKIQIEPFVVDGILIPEDGQLKKEMGEVISVGKGVTFVKKGDTLVFASWGAEKVDQEDKTYWVVKEDSLFILGKITKNEPEK